METIKFQFWLYSDYWLNPPGISASINNTEKFNCLLTDSGLNYLEFDHSFKDDGEYCLILNRFNKDDRQTKIEDDGTVKDQLLKINTIKIDGINIQNLIYKHSWYEPKYPEPWASEQRLSGNVLENKVFAETNLGHNGVWKIELSSPFYKHIIETIIK